MPNSIIITPTRRLAFSLQQFYAEHQSSFPAPTILPLATWVEQCWQEALCANKSDAPTLLNEHQETIIWQDIIQQSPYGTTLLSVNHAASLAKQAWQLLKQWQIDFTVLRVTHTEDVSAFYEWAVQFHEQCAQKNYIVQSELIDSVANFFHKQVICPPKQLIFMSFIEHTPQLQHLIKQLNSSGCKIENIHPGLKHNTRYQLVLANSETELLTMARWAKQILLSAKKPPRIACIISNLASQRQQVDATFTEVLAPELLLNCDPTYKKPFNISAGIPFSQYPLVSTALQLIKMGDSPISLTTLYCLLHTPFIAGANIEMTLRAQWDADLRATGASYFYLNDLVDQKAVPCPILHKSLQQLRHLIIQTPNQQLPSAWAVTFMQQLTLLGWANAENFNSSQHQQLERWQELIEEFSTLDRFISNINYQQAVTHLTQLADNIIFQPKADDAPVQILGTLEAAGLPFEYAWIAGLHDGLWPPAPNPNPFLPLALQKKFNMPHATAAREYHFNQLLLDQLCQQAPQLILSYPQRNEEEELRPSAYLQNVPIGHLDDLQLPNYFSLAQQIAEKIEYEWIVDDIAPAVSTGEKIRGGTGILKHQAACPFRAFAQYRLGAQELASPSKGFTAMERGTLLHEALQKIWNRIKDHATLIAQTEQNLHKVISTAVKQAIANFPSQIRRLSQQFLHIEYQRLVRLIQQWLTVEKSREPFRIIATEQRYEFTLQGLSISAQADRVDELANGSRIIIDYKTGECTINAWFGERLDEPQLPFYCISSTETISGLAFAQIRANAVQLKGLAEQHVAELQRQLKPIANWTQQTQEWQEALQYLAQQFQTGYAKVDPKNSSQTCQFCDLSLLCRVSS